MSDAGHFSEEQWIDYARDLAPTDQARLMAAHLASGCRACGTAHQEWTAVCELARTTLALEPSDATLRVATALFAIQRPPGPVARTVAAVRTLFDSQLAPAPAGVRAVADTRARKVLYATGDFLVDLQIETTRQSGCALVIGQVVSAGEPRASVHGVPVVILRDMQVLGKAMTNWLGEFHIEFEGPTQGLSVALGLKPEGMVVALGGSSMRAS